MILQAIRDKYPTLEHLRIRSIVATQYTHTVDCVISCFNLASIDYNTRKDIVSIVYSHAPKGYRMNCSFEDDKFTANAFAKYMQETINSTFGIMGGVALEDIVVTASGARSFDVLLHINTMQQNIYDECQFDKKFAEILSAYTCYTCNVQLVIRQVQQSNIDKIIANQNKLEQLSISRIVNAPSRHLAIDVASVCFKSKVTSMPRYIFDVRSAGKVTICGKVSGFSSKVSSKNDKLTIIKFKLTDPSGQMDVVLFSKHKEEDDAVLRKTQDIDADKAEAIAKRNKAYNDRTKTKLLHLCEGVTIVVEGRAVVNEFSNSIEMLADKVQTCKIREHQQDSYHATPTDKYTVIQPVIMNNASEQQSLFGNSRYIPDMLRGDTVVFELTTTGDNVFKDMILAIGCVKISNGVVVSRLSTLLNPDTKLSPQLEQQLQLTTAQLLYYPTLSEIIPDIYKFCYGAKLIGSDINHHIAMLQYYADSRQYLFANTKSFYLEFVNNMLVAEDINVSFPVAKELYKYCKVEPKPHATACDSALLFGKCLVSLVTR